MRGWAWIAAGVIATGLAALAWGMTTSNVTPEQSDDIPAPPQTEPTNAPESRGVPSRPSDPASASRPTPPPGLQLGDGSKPGARSNAQAIADASLEELQRYDEVDIAVARELYLRGLAALERVEDELAEDDEPGHTKLRADSDALRAEMERLFGPD